MGNKETIKDEEDVRMNFFKTKGFEKQAESRINSGIKSAASSYFGKRKPGMISRVSGSFEQKNYVRARNISVPAINLMRARAGVGPRDDNTTFQVRGHPDITKTDDVDVGDPEWLR